MANILKVTFVIVGTIIGAGFASGQEILTFFNRYGIYGLIGLAFSISLIGIIIYKTLKINLENNINTYQKFIENIIPDRFKENKILIFTINNIINIFLLISFNVMAAGFSTYFFQEFAIPKIIGSLIITIISYITFLKNLNGIVKINTILIPILLTSIILLGIAKINSIQIVETSKNPKWIISSIVYASYNSISLIPILISLKKCIKTKKEAGLVSICATIIMLILSLVIYLLMNNYWKEIKTIEIPIIYIASLLGSMAKYIYGALILIAIFTTAISAGYGFLNNTTKHRKDYLKMALIICIISIFFGQLSFSNLISFLYPVFGYLGILQIFFLLTA